nr:hypothetical protein [Bradyrhizobium sp. CCGB01]
MKPQPSCGRSAIGIQQVRPITVRENREWKPAVAYCRYADVIVKGTNAYAEAVRKECRAFLEGKLTLNMEKTHITHVNDGFVFLGHRIIRKRGSSGRMAVVTTIPKEKAKAFARRLSKVLSGDHDLAKVDTGPPEPPTAGLGGLLQVHELHCDHVTARRSCRVLENGALACEKVSESHQTIDAKLVSSTSRWAGQDQVCPRGRERGPCREHCTDWYPVQRSSSDGETRKQIPTSSGRSPGRPSPRDIIDVATATGQT